MLETPRGIVRTPCFMPVGTKGTVKAMTPDRLKAVGAQIVLANTYHLALRPGSDTVRRLGGLHAFMQWDGPMLTDSGGYQVFSLRDTAKVDDSGVAFRSIYDGSKHVFTPERAMAEQQALGADFIMCFDQCPPGTATESEVAEAVQAHVGSGRNAARRPTRSATASVPTGPRCCWVSCRGESSRACGGRARSGCWRSVFPATPSGA